MKRAQTIRAVLTLAASLTAGCSIIVNPDPNRLNPPDATAEGGTFDVAQADGASDVARPDVTSDRGPDLPCGSDCNDNVPCTRDLCDNTTLRCVHEPRDAQCTNGDRCDIVRGCTSQGCTGNAQCDDRDPCTGTETCNNGACVNGTALACDDGMFCNGMELCIPMQGCAPGTSPTCNDNLACTTDRCDPAAAAGAGACATAALDMDMDNAPAASANGAACAGGTDCDDNDPNVKPGATETCNGRDDNCDGQTDNVAGGCTATNDTCANATRVTLVNGVVQNLTGTTLGAQDNANPGCSDSNGADVYYAVTFPGNNDMLVEVIAAGTTDPVVSLRDSCQASGELACSDDTATRASTAADKKNSRIWFRPSPYANGNARTIIVVVDSYDAQSAGPFTLRLLTTPAIGSSACAATMTDVSAGGTVYGATALRFGNQHASCNTRTIDGTEESFLFNSATAGEVQLIANSTAFRPVLFVRRGMCGNGAEAACVQAGGDTATTSYAHTSGAAYIFVDGQTNASDRYTLRVLRP